MKFLLSQKKKNFQAINEILGTKVDNLALRRFFYKKRIEERRQQIEDNNSENSQFRNSSTGNHGFRSRSVNSASSLLNPLSLFRLINK